MGLIRKYVWLKLYRKHGKKVILVGVCLGFALIILKIDELLNGYKNSQESKSESDLSQLQNLKLNLQKNDFLARVFNITDRDSQPNNKLKYNLIWMEQMTRKMERRRKKLQENCELFRLNVRGNDSLHRPNTWEFLINRPFRLVWCNVFKAASTSWMYNFNILAGYTPKFLKQAKEVPLELARKKYPRPSIESLEEALNDSISFLIVRHPFERFLSAFRDKIEFALPNTHHQKVGNLIIEKYREGNDEKVEKSFSSDKLKKKTKRPTFPEFVKYVLHQYQLNEPMDMHWTPITGFCTPCQVRFDVIMKFETLQDDQNYLIRKTNLQNKIEPQWKNPSKGRRSIYLIDQYYSQLNANQIYELYKLYKYDFYLFDYKLDDYIKYLNINETITEELKALL